MARPALAAAQATSLIVEGVFEKFPTLKFAFIEVQQMWAVQVMWHLDFDWKSIRDQTPWLERLPSQYFREHIRIRSRESCRAVAGLGARGGRVKFGVWVNCAGGGKCRSTSSVRCSASRSVRF